jgi:type VI secretion system protein ImpC
LWLCLTANRLALRAGWDEESPAVKKLTWRASADTQATMPLWGSGVWAMGHALSRSFSEQGLRFPCCGADSPGSLDDLPLVTYQTKKETFLYPLEVRYSDQRAFELNQTGFAPLVAATGSDTAYFRTAPTFHKPARYDTKEATRASFLAVTLPYQIFAGMAAHVVQRAGMGIGGGASEDEIKERFRNRLLAFLGSCEDSPGPEEAVVELSDNEESPDLVDVSIRVQPGFTISGGDVDLMVGTTVPR